MSHLLKSKWLKLLLILALIPMNVDARVKNQSWKKPFVFPKVEECDDSQLENRVRECNIATDACSVCMVAAVAAAAAASVFTLGMSFAAVGVACAAPCGIAQGMCDHMQATRNGYNNCLYSSKKYVEMMAEAVRGKDAVEAEWLPKMSDEVKRHEQVVSAIKSYPEAVLKELYKKLREEGIDTDSADAQTFIDLHMKEAKKLIDQKMEEERVKFFRFYTEGFGNIYHYFQMEDPWQEFIDECQRIEIEDGWQKGRECFLDKCVQKGYFDHENLYPSPPYYPRLFRCSEGMTE